MKYDRNNIIEKLQSYLSPKRFLHTIGVEETALKLAEIYSVDKNSVSVAALLHDCAKDMPKELALRLCKEYHIDLDNPNKYLEVLHSFLGAEIAKREYNISNTNILNAIKYHTTGHANMTILEKIIFISDYIEPNRKTFHKLTEIRELAFHNIDKAILLALQNTIIYVKNKNNSLHPLTIEAKDYLLKNF